VADRATVVIGVGNPLRRDDAAGLEVARRVRAAAPSGVTVVEHDGEPAALLDALRGARAAVIVDAVAGDGPPGAVGRHDAAAAPLPAALGSASTHGVGVPEAIELGRALGRLPAQLVVVTVGGGDFGTGEGLTSPVEHALGEATTAVLAELRSWVTMAP
jgi:hydrogenase maturation protease